MLRCSRCQTETPADAQFCDNCGNRLGASAAGPTAASTTCPSCGRPAPLGAQFCAGCGKTLARVEYASFWRRLGGFLLDVLIVVPTSILVLVVLSFIIPTPGTEQFDAVDTAGIPLAILLVSMYGPAFGYFVLMNANGGTLGKRAVGIRLEDAKTGENIGNGRAFGRLFVAYVAYSFLLLGYFWCIWDDKKQTWHDKAVGSIVVRR